MKKIALDTATFERFRMPDVVYVDKTAYLHRLVSDPEQARFFFIARPRRFGKSLMISTLQAIFEGRKELFEGLAISKTDYDWQVYPVIHLSFANRNVSTAEMGKKSLTDYLEATLRATGYAYNPGVVPEQNFANAIQFLHQRTGKRVVVLIDEYDGPVGEAFDDLQKAEEIRSFLADIYGQIKENEAIIRFAMLTGVTRFTNLSVFSKLNNMMDLSQTPEFATMLGYTEEELVANFSEHLHAHAQVMGLSDEDYLEKLRAWYDGYRFSALNDARVYNPIAIAKTLTAMAPFFSSTWVATGRPTIIAKFARRKGMTLRSFEEPRSVVLSEMASSTLDTVEETELLYQTGYLTIDDVIQGDEVTLRVPNEEVRHDFDTFLLKITFGDTNAKQMIDGVRDALRLGKFNDFFAQVKALFAKAYYSPTENAEEKIEEASYLRTLHVFLSALPAPYKTSVQVNAAGKRADLVLEAAYGTFIFELKRSDNGTAKDAIEQIRANHYAEPFLASGRPVHLIGLVFDKKTHLLVDALAEPYTQA